MHNQSVSFQSWLKHEVAAGSNPKKSADEASLSGAAAKEAGIDAAPVASYHTVVHIFISRYFLNVHIKIRQKYKQKILYNSLQSSALTVYSSAPVGHWLSKS